MNNAVMRGAGSMDVKKLSISSKRQITIPQKFFAALGFDTEAECTVRGNELIIRPVKNNVGGEFAEQILADLISKGYSGHELLNEFRAMQNQVRPAVEKILEEAHNVSLSQDEYESYNDVFGSGE